MLYKTDNVFVIGGWFNRTRSFAHMLTNNNGDSLLTAGEKDSSFHTNNYSNGWYRVYVRAFDIVGNSVLDSENVYFNNPNPTALQDKPGLDLRVSGKYPETVVRFTLSNPSPVVLEVYDAAGTRLRQIRVGNPGTGEQAAMWDGRNASGEMAGRGLYFVRLRGDGFTVSTKTVCR